MKPRRSANSTAISFSCPCRWVDWAKPSRGPAAGGSSGATAISERGRVWQASRTLGGAPTRRSTASSCGEGGGNVSMPRLIRMRQVEQRPRPPQTDACGMPAIWLASRTVMPGIDPDLAAAGIDQPDQTATLFDQAADQPRRQRQADRGGEEPDDPAFEFKDFGDGGGIGRLHLGDDVAQPSLVLREFQDLAPGRRESQQRQHRHQQGAGEQERLQPVEDRLQPQPEPQADAAVDPGGDQGNRLLHPAARAHMP